MKKTIIFCLSIALCLSMTACGKKAADKAANAPAGGLEVKEKNTLSGWLSKGKAIECEVLSPEGKVVIKSKNEAVRMEGISYFSLDSAGAQPNAANGVWLNAGGWMYMWDAETKKGSKINMAALSEANTDDQDGDIGKTWNEMVAEWDKTEIGYDCQETAMADELFIEPSDIEFTDLTEILTSAENLLAPVADDSAEPPMPDMSDLENLKIPAGANQEDIEALLENMETEIE